MATFQFSEIQYSSPEYAAAFELREEVLRKPLGLSLNDETLAQEPDYFHLVCHLEGELVGCLVLLPKEEGTVGMRQVAIKPHLQGQGIGRALIEYAEEFARERGFALMKLHARETAIPFYEKLGYERVGEPFIQGSIAHLEMRKEL